jgi:hypothetical protein
MEWRRFRQKEACPKDACTAHSAWGRALLDEAIPRGLPGDFTCDSSCTSAKGLQQRQDTQRASGGDVQRNRTVVYDGRAQSLQAVARQRPWQANKPVRVGTRRYGYFRKQRRIADVTHPVRIGLVWKARDAAEARKALVRKRLGGREDAGGGGSGTAGQGPRRFLGTGSRSGASARGRGAAARGRPATCLSAAQRTVC